jgi:inosose dehydratase
MDDVRAPQSPVDRIAGAPISWGVCEVPDWGYQDVDGRLARQVRSGRVAYAEAVRAGLYRPLGQGDVDVPAIVEHLVASGYTGWYVLERDTVLTDEPVGEGPAADVHPSAEHLRGLLTRRALVP